MTKNSFNMNKIYGLANKVAFFAPYAAVALDTSLSPASKVNRGVAYISGFNMATGTWSFESLKAGWTPYVVTKILTSVVPRITSFVRGLF